MIFVDKTESCKPYWGSRRRSIDLIDTVMVHRIFIQDVVSTPELARWFTRHPEIQIPSMPYTFIVWPDGVVEQALPLTVLSPHGKSWNTRAIGVGFWGDFTHVAPTAEQLIAGQELVSVLAHAFTLKTSIVGHTYVAEATNDTGKDCPGKLFPLESFSSGIEYGLKSEGLHRMQQIGIIF